MCGVSADRCTGFSAVRWLFGSSMLGLLTVLFAHFSIRSRRHQAFVDFSVCHTPVRVVAQLKDVNDHS